MRKIHLEIQNKVAEGKLAARLAYLQEKGLEGAAIQKDTLIRNIRAQIRKVNYRLACIAAQEKLTAERAQTKAEKLAKGKSIPEEPPAKKTKGVSKKKEKKEKTKAEEFAKEKSTAEMPPEEASEANSKKKGKKEETKAEELAKEEDTPEMAPAEMTEADSKKKGKKEKTKEPSDTAEVQEQEPEPDESSSE